MQNLKRQDHRYRNCNSSDLATALVGMTEPQGYAGTSRCLKETPRNDIPSATLRVRSSLPLVFGWNSRSAGLLKSS